MSLVLRLAATVAAWLLAGAAAAAPADRYFRVFLDEREIGTHDFRFTDADGGYRLVSEARYRVKVLFVTAFRYEHTSRERWRDGCLVRIDSETDDDGDAYEVEGRATGSGFSLTTLERGSTLEEPCVWTFAYWRPGIRERSRLMNAQTGRVHDVRVTDEGPARLRLPDGDVQARRWHLGGEDTDISIYYDAEGRWLGLESPAGDRTLRYVPGARDPLAP